MKRTLLAGKEFQPIKQLGHAAVGKIPKKSLFSFQELNITYDSIPLNSFMELQTSSTDNHIQHAKITDELGN